MVSNRPGLRATPAMAKSHGNVRPHHGSPKGTDGCHLLPEPGFLVGDGQMAQGLYRLDAKSQINPAGICAQPGYEFNKRHHAMNLPHEISDDLKARLALCQE